MHWLSLRFGGPQDDRAGLLRCLDRCLGYHSRRSVDSRAV
jgi:hypothetical protein